MTPQELKQRFKRLLFKKDSNDELRFWAIERIDSEYSSVLQIFHGLVSSSILYPKETISWSSTDGPYYRDECINEEDTRWLKQINQKGYTEEIPDNPPERPMLCLDFNEHSNYFDLNETVLVQPKLDGMRCISINGKLFSRYGEPITGVPHIKPPPGKWDGELYVHGWSFEQNISVAKSRFPHAMHRQMKYHVFDCINNEPQSTRIQKIQEEFGGSQFEHIKCVETIPVLYSKEMIELLHEKSKEKGYEGIIVRAYHGYYEPNKRSKYLQKYKKFLDDWFPLVGIDEGTGSSAGQAIFICQLPSGATFRCVPSMDRNTKRGLFKERERFIGKYKVHVRFLNYTNDLVPRHPVGVEICSIA